MPSLPAELYRDLSESAPDALLLVDSSGTIIYANAQAHAQFKYERGELVGKLVEQLIPAESRVSHAAHRAAYSRDPRLREMGNRGMPLFGLRKDGSRFRAEIRLAPIRGADGVVSAAAIRDATETERIMDMLACARRTAEEAAEVKSRFLAAASHDLRQPLQTLRLLNSVLKRLAQDPDMVNVLEQEERALGTMSDLLHALLNISKLESGTMQPTASDTSMTAIFDDLQHQFASLAKLKNLELRIETPDVHLRTDPILFREMLQNLLANAVRYTDQGSVRVQCVVGPDRQAQIEIEDTGIGIPALTLERIFDDFFQGASPGVSHRGGTGLGLGIVRRLTKMLDIPVHVTSTVGVGTRFTLDVVTLDQPAAPAVVAQSREAQRPNPRRSIILVEDEAGLRRALTIFLSLDSHEVHGVGSLGELDELLQELAPTPSIIISDYHLGGQERGSDAIHKVRLHFRRQIPAIVLTGDTSAVPARLAEQPGIRMLNKPVDAAALTALMDDLLGS